MNDEDARIALAEVLRRMDPEQLRRAMEVALTGRVACPPVTPPVLGGMLPDCPCRCHR